MNVKLLIRLFAALGVCLSSAYIGGLATGHDLWGFVESYKMPYYGFVAVVGYLLINPALKARRTSES
ncbi:MAG: hypothetical protein VX589_21510 [Myxococcota bacterium]|nr:hypothetical protein [Myxococcota bacterium]